MKQHSKTKIVLIILALTLVFSATVFSACEKTDSFINYKYITQMDYFGQPSIVEPAAYESLLTVSIGQDEFYFKPFYSEEAADIFVNAQIGLLSYLQRRGMECTGIKYYVSNYEQSFSDSQNKRAYISFSSAKTYEQVLATLQTLYGDYANYGYLYALSNSIADDLNWIVDGTPNIKRSDQNGFFNNNPEALDLSYPCFTVAYADQTVVDNCKALSKNLLSKLNWKMLLSQPIAKQLSKFYEKISDYARKVGQDYLRQGYEYAYYGKYQPLKIKLGYVELFIDAEYKDYYFDFYETDHLASYKTIFETANIINNETSTAIEKHLLTNSAETVSIFLMSKDTSLSKFGRALFNGCYAASKEIYITTLQGYLHEYYHYIEFLLNPNSGRHWQSQAFCEWGRANSYYSQVLVDKPFTQNKNWVDLFFACTGRGYEPTKDDYFLTCDILCFITDEYEMDYYAGRNPINSFTYYLVDIYSEESILQLLLYPNQVTETTGKSWETLQTEWERHIKDKFKDVTLPDWVTP